jgi:hypothetical protein
MPTMNFSGSSQYTGAASITFSDLVNNEQSQLLKDSPRNAYLDDSITKPQAILNQAGEVPNQDNTRVFPKPKKKRGKKNTKTTLNSEQPLQLKPQEKAALATIEKPTTEIANKLTNDLIKNHHDMNAKSPLTVPRFSSPRIPSASIPPRISSAAASKSASQPEAGQVKDHPANALRKHLNNSENHNKPATSSITKTVRRSGRYQDPLIDLPAPNPTPEYLLQASEEPRRRPSQKRHLLVILDLNGTLLDRGNSIRGTARPFLEEFLRYCFDNHSVMVWSSARPSSVETMCSFIFSPQYREKLVATWARDTLGLTAYQYKQRVQVYKQLQKVWKNSAIAHCHPDRLNGQTWDQTNTILVDDSTKKAAAQPFNHIAIPEFLISRTRQEVEQKVLFRVQDYLEEARHYDDVSSYIKSKPFAMAAEQKSSFDENLGVE